MWLGGGPLPTFNQKKICTSFATEPGGNVCVYVGGGQRTRQKEFVKFLNFLSSLRSQNNLFLTYLYNGFDFILMFITTA